MGDRPVIHGGLLFGVFLLWAAYLPANAGIVYVKASATGANNGSSWTDAYTDLQNALVPAVPGDSIWIAAGTYKPTPGTDRTATFQLLSGVAVFGGFAGTETNLNERDWETNVTILSGDIGVEFGNIDNSYHVVTGSGARWGAVLDGVTITAGRADGASDDAKGGGMLNDAGGAKLVNVTFYGNYGANGGGMYNLGNSSPTLVKVTFSENYAGYNGGGVFNLDSSPMFIDVVFSGNQAERNGGGMLNGVRSNPGVASATFSGNSAGFFGGGMCNDKNSNPTCSDVTFSGNYAEYGGGMWNTNSSPTITHAVFSLNSAIYGGGMWSSGGSPTLSGVVFSQNSAASRGGGMLNESDCSAALRDVTFTGNYADFDAAGMYNEASSPTLINVVFSGNFADQQDGGGMYNVFGSDAVLVNVVFWGNYAQNGGAMWNYLSNPTLTNVTFSGNSADLSGGGIWNYGSTPVLTNVILWVDYAGSSGTEIANNSSIPAISYSLVDGSGGSGAGWYASLGVDGGHNVDGDPLFLDSPRGNFRLENAYSPAVNAGNNAALPPGVPSDPDGNPRVSGDTVDMGAYEFQVLTAIQSDRQLQALQIVSVSPNPFNPSTTVRFTLPLAVPVTADVWSVTGARVRVLAKEQPYGPGESQIEWDGRNDEGSRVASGVYFVRIQTPLGTRIARAVMLK